MLGLLTGLVVALAAVTWAHLKRTGQAQATPFPSLQHLGGPTVPRRRRPRLDDVLGWALRCGVLMCLVAGVCADRQQLYPGPLPRVVLIDPATGAQGWALAAHGARDTRLGFEQGQVRAEGELANWLAPIVRACSASVRRCLARAAVHAQRPVLVVAAPSTSGWEGLDEFTADLEWLEVPSQPAGESVAEPTAQATAFAAPSIERVGTSAAAWVWAAALREAAGTMTGSLTVAVCDPGSCEADAGAKVVALTGPREAEAGWPAVRSLPVHAVQLDVSVAQTPALVVEASLSFEASPSQFIGGLAAQRGREVAVAATEADLGRWAHEGQLLPLARVLLNTLGAQRTSTDWPLGGRWRDEHGTAVPLGVLDLAPGKYTRADGTVVVQLTRASTETTTRQVGPHRAQPAWSLPCTLFAVALVVLVVASLRERRVSSGLLALGAAVVLSVWLLNVQREAPRVPRQAVRLGVGLDEAVAEAVLDAGLSLAPCAECLEVARLDTPRGAAVAGSSGVVFSLTQPRVDVLSVRAPDELVLGQAAQVEVAIRVRRAAGQLLTVNAAPSHGAPTARTLTVDGADVVLGVTLPVVPLLAGVENVTVEASVPGAEDAAQTSCEVVSRRVRRMVLAGAPSWDARFAKEALRTHADGETATLTRIGATAVQAMGVARADPLRLVVTPHALDDVATVVLTGFTTAELAGAPARALTAFVEGGGALVFLGSSGIEALGWPSLGSPEGPDKRLAALLEPGAEPIEITAVSMPPSTGPLAHEVLASVGGQPWVVGRAQGLGRVTVVRGTDLFRLSPVAGQEGVAERVFFRALGWAEAAPSAAAPREAQPLRSHQPRAIRRAEAQRARQPFVELDGPEEVAETFRNVPPLPARGWPSPLRHDWWLFVSVLGLLVGEALTSAHARRRRSSA